MNLSRIFHFPSPKGIATSVYVYVLMPLGDETDKIPTEPFKVTNDEYWGYFL